VSRLPDLPAELDNQIEKHLEYELPQGLAAQLEEAWEMLPEPRLEWNYWPQSIAKSACDYAVEIQDWALAERWLARGRDAYAVVSTGDPMGDAPMDHWEARIRVARGDADAAEYCRGLLAKHGPNFFKGPDDQAVRSLLAQS